MISDGVTFACIHDVLTSHRCRLMLNQVGGFNQQIQRERNFRVQGNRASRPRSRPSVSLPADHPALVPEAGHIQRFDTLDGRTIGSLFGKLFAFRTIGWDIPAVL